MCVCGVTCEGKIKKNEENRTGIGYSRGKSNSHKKNLIRKRRGKRNKRVKGEKGRV